jgi:hypothetical protein
MREDPIAKALFERFNRIRMPNLNLSEDEAGEILAYVDAQAARRP